MKQVIIILSTLLLCIQTASAISAKVLKIGNTFLSKYTIVYNEKLENEEGLTLATDIQSDWESEMKHTLPISNTSSFKNGKAIRLIHSKEMKTFCYKVYLSKGNLVIDGGGCWAMKYASQLALEAIKQGKLNSNYSVSGTVEGKFLFPRPEGVNLRILDDNVWNFTSETIPVEWQQAGIDCRDKARSPEYAQLIRAYMPDIICMQEYTRHMHNELNPMISKYGYQISFEVEGNPWTPIFYRPEVLELLEKKYVPYTPKQWSDVESKGYCSAVFKHKATGKIFAVINTHLWWKDEEAQKGSTYARASQIYLMMAESELIKAKYNCPIFVTGDMNCEENTLPLQNFIKGGYKPCYKVATLYANHDNGHHQCFPHEVGVRTSHRISPKRELGAIDHCLIYNAQKTEIKVFDCIQPYFTVKLTDHYPNLIDAVLK